jgi:hypothetical protein
MRLWLRRFTIDLGACHHALVDSLHLGSFARRQESRPGDLSHDDRSDRAKEQMGRPLLPGLDRSIPREKLAYTDFKSKQPDLIKQCDEQQIP